VPVEDPKASSLCATEAGKISKKSQGHNSKEERLSGLTCHRSGSQPNRIDRQWYKKVIFCSKTRGERAERGRGGESPEGPRGVCTEETIVESLKSDLVLPCNLKGDSSDGKGGEGGEVNDGQLKGRKRLNEVGSRVEPY